MDILNTVPLFPGLNMPPEAGAGLPADDMTIQTPQQFYQSEAVQQRLAEYCGGNPLDPESFSTEYLSGVSETLKQDRFSEEYFFSASRSSFFWLLEHGVDLFRAVWDRTSTLGVLDMEYFNLVYPAEAYFNPGEVFTSLEPIYRRIEKVFRRFSLHPLPIMTGQGYHFSFRIDFSSPVHAQLVALGKLEQTLVGKYSAPSGSRTRPVPLSVGLAFDGMGRIMEYFAHLLLRELRTGYKGMPVVCTDLSVGKAREAIALDLSMYADPVYTRDVRCPFSTYQKHKVLQEKFGYRAASEVPVFVTLPRNGHHPLSGYLEMRRDFAASQRYAAEVETRVPEGSEGFRKLIKSYRASRLFRFHKYFDAAEHDDPGRWPETYDRLELDRLPPCVAHCLQYPNDNLLKPTNIQALTRVLMRRGWHPKHIAGLVRSKLERDFGWGTQWFRYDASARANYYVRLFSGLILCGVDEEEDLNCLSHAEKGYCLRPGCGHNLAEYKIV
ncbi:MAG: hypothetical protein ACYC5N_06385 [Endomicrobiales bacterium]